MKMKYIAILLLILSGTSSFGMEVDAQERTPLPLPTELISHVFDYIDNFEDLCRLNMVCRDFNKMATEIQERLWKGYYPYSDLSYDRLDSYFKYFGNTKKNRKTLNYLRKK